MTNLSSNQLAYLKAMGIQAWERQGSAPIDPAESEWTEEIPFTNNTVATDEKILDLSAWEHLQQCVKECTACPLAQTRTQTVFGVGNTSTKLMIIGEAPGFYEDKQGEPFVGRAGQLLNAMLQSIGLARSSVFIANILKCRPPENRDPLAEEVKSCTPFLEKQIELIQPTLLLAVGRIAAHYLLNTKTAMTQLRGKQYSYQNIPLIVTFHPAYLLRNPKDKRKAFEDLVLARQLLGATH